MATSARVPDEGELLLGPVRLPAGRQLRWRANDPVAWMTEAPVPEPGLVWSALSALHGQTGLVPILAPGRPGEDLEAAAFGEMAMVGDVDQVDVAAILEDRWIGSFPELWQTGPERAEDWEWAEDTTAPFTSGYPGLAPAVDATLAPDVLDGVVRSFPTSRIALVPADRPADVLPLLGWYPGNWDCAFPAPSSVAFAAVMRSWEDRFGARLFAITQDQAYLLVERPPADLDAALPVAAEHFVFCDEPAGRQPVRATAAEIIGAPLWYFWWD
jgi:hypothetical protein